MKIILIMLLIHYVLYFARKSKKGSSILGCGLFAWVGDDVKNFNKDKFDKLGIYNDIRGKHSCGIAVDGVLHKGIHTKKLYKDFLTKETIKAPDNIPVVIGHTRFATSGSHTLANAHPFKFNYEDNKFFIGAHNGSLINHKALAKKYGVSENKIDSQILLEIISKDDANIAVLEEYYGAAALLMYSSENKDTLYVFRGKSKESNSQYATEERPLFYWQENENSMYLSSIKDSLLSIMNCKEDEDNIFEIQPNNVYEIIGGKINRKLKIDRSKAQEEYYKTFSNNKGTNSKVSDKSKTIIDTKIKNLNISSTTSHKVNNLFYEKPIILGANDDTVFSKLRWQRNGHLVSGIFVFIDDVGYVKLCDNYENINSSLANFTFEDKTLTPTEYIKFNDIENVSLFYIHNGVMLETYEDYAFCLNPSLARKDKPTFEDYTDMAVHPIIDLDRMEHKNQRIDAKDQKISKDRKLYTGTIEIPGSPVKYIVSNGVLESSESSTILKNHLPSVNTLDVYDNINITSNDEDQDDQEDISFEDNLSEIMDNDNIDEIDSILEIVSNYKQGYELAQTLNELGPNSKLAKLVIEFSESLNTNILPISEALEKINVNS